MTTISWVLVWKASNTLSRVLAKLHSYPSFSHASQNASLWKSSFPNASRTWNTEKAAPYFHTWLHSSSLSTGLYICTYIHTHHTVYDYALIYRPVYIYIYIYIYISYGFRLGAYLPACIYIYIYIYIYMYIHITRFMIRAYLPACIYKYIHTIRFMTTCVMYEYASLVMVKNRARKLQQLMCT
jgi:hypothetical protein